MKEPTKNKETGLVRVRFSIGAKLVIIIAAIVLLSLGSITALVSWLVREDLRVSAEGNNYELNKRSATEAEYTLATIRSSARMLMQTVIALGTESDLAQQEADDYFEQNPQTAAFIFTVPGREHQFLTNSRFFAAKGIDAGLADSYWENMGEALRRARLGEPVILNAAPHFKSSVLAMFFPGRNGTSGGVLFSPENLNETFSSGVNQSWLINSSGDILIHTDFSLVRDGVNIAEQSFIKSVRDSNDRSRQSLIWMEDVSSNNSVRCYLAYTKLNAAGCIVITSIEYDKVFEGITATTRRNIYLTATVLLLSIMLIWFFAKTISVPLKGLASAAHTIEGGSFDLQLTPKSRDEIGVLTSSFQRMCTALGIFGRFTNRDIAVRAMQGKIRPGGLPKHATVFFSDIRNFTSISEKFAKAFDEDASDRIVFWLNNYLTQMIECIEKTDGVVDKFIGDAVMAHWGTAYTAGSPQKDAYNCVRAALMMRKALYDMNKTRMPGDLGNPPILIGCGINTGIVTAGQIGSDMRMEYTVIGDPVNLASRTEALCKPMGADILITEETWKLVGKHFITEEMPPVTVKGKEKPVRIFAVVNLQSASGGPRTLADVRKLLGIEAPDISKIDVNAEEKKYKIAGQKQ